MEDQPSIDYAAVLADLEARRDLLDKAIAGIRLLAEAGTPGPAITATITPGVPVPKMDVQDIPGDAFFNMSIADATRKYLGAVKRKQRQIKKALLAGGLHSTSKSFTTTLYSVLERQPDIIRVGKDWGLASLYPGLNRGAKGGKRAAKPGITSKAKAPKSTAPPKATATGKRRGRPPKKLNLGKTLAQVDSGDDGPDDAPADRSMTAA